MTDKHHMIISVDVEKLAKSWYLMRLNFPKVSIEGMYLKHNKDSILQTQLTS